MSDRLKIMACGYVSRDDKNILKEAQLNVLDTITHKTYNVLCESVYIDQDTYRIRVCGTSTDNIIDECIMDSTGGIFMGEDFSYDEIDDDLGFRIVELITSYFIIPF